MLLNLTLEELMTGIIEIIFISVILFLVSTVFLKWYAKKKGYDQPLEERIGSTHKRIVWMVSLIWLAVNVTLDFLILFLLGTSIIYDPIVVGAEIIIISFVIQQFYNKSFTESLIFAAVTQALLYVVKIILVQFIGAIFLMVSDANNQQLSSSGTIHF